MAYTAVLIDDEYWALTGIDRSFSWERFGFEVVLRETNAARALRFILETKPDAVFTDIRMNSLTGLDLIRAAREAGLDTEFVIISGYSDFRYAQSAIHDGVFQYLLKPLDIAETDDVLLALSNRLLEKRAAYSPYDWVDDVRGAKKTFQRYCADKGIAPRYARFHLVTMGCSGLPDGLAGDRTLQIIDIVRFGWKKCAAVLCADGDIRPALDAVGRHVVIGVSRPARASDGVYNSFRESDVAYAQSLFSGDKGLRLYRQDAARETAQMAARLMAVFAAGSPESIAAAMREGIEALPRDALTVEDLALLYNHVLTGLKANKQFNFPAGVDTLDYRGVQSLFSSGDDFFHFLSELVNPARFRHERPNAKDKRQMEAILAYIDENYARPLYLSDLSKRFFLSQTSICDLFRRNLKTSFMNHLTELRMNEALRLLATTRTSVMDIAETVGYRDQYYFSRLFRKQTGLSPQQYRRLHQDGPQEEG